MSDDVRAQRLPSWIVDSVDRLHSIAIAQAELGDLSALEQLLFRGWMIPPEIQLTQAESHFLWKMLRRERKRLEAEKIRRERNSRRGRLPVEGADKKAKHVAIFSFLHELDGAPTESAVASARQLYGVSRTTVFAAREKWGSYWEQLQAATFEERQSCRRWIENQARLLRSS